MQTEINVVIGSWGSYNECNERALGSQWLNFADYESWEDIEEVLTKQGFDLNGIDEELFIQDIEGLPCDSASWDYIHPQKLFEALYNSDVLSDSHKSKMLDAYLEIRTLTDFFELVDSKGSNWDDDIQLYAGFDWDAYGRELFECCADKLDDRLADYFDFEAYGKAFGEYATEYSGGIIEIFE